MRHAALYCEGYLDRAFLAGWLETRGWIDPGLVNGRRIPVRNPVTQEVVAGGRFAFRFKDSMFLEVIPSGGKEQAVYHACRKMKNSLTEGTPPACVLVACDLDDEALDDYRRSLKQRLEDSREPSLPIATSSLIWHVVGDFGPGVPAKQTLERLVCGALSRVHVSRGGIVEDWLAAAGAAELSPKNYAWSHMAGWYARHGCEDFFRQVWREEAVCTELQDLLEDCGSPELAALESEG